MSEVDKAVLRVLGVFLLVDAWLAFLVLLGLAFKL
jgi:hypothetical protein